MEEDSKTLLGTWIEAVISFHNRRISSHVTRDVGGISRRELLCLSCGAFSSHFSLVTLLVFPLSLLASLVFG